MYCTDVQYMGQDASRQNTENPRLTDWPCLKKNGAEMKLTDSQEKILHFIQKQCAKTGIPPSFREIQNAFGYKSINSVQTHVEALKKKGALETFSKERQARGLLPAGFVQPFVKRLPIYGEIAAGSPRDSDQLELGTLCISEEVSKTASFALRVRGDSMIEAGILEGDHLIVDKKARTRSGDIVVALLDGETTVKRLMEKEGEVFLLPENKNLKPIPTKGKKLLIQGKVVGLQRKL